MLPGDAVTWSSQPFSELETRGLKLEPQQALPMTMIQLSKVTGSHRGLERGKGSWMGFRGPGDGLQRAFDRPPPHVLYLVMCSKVPAATSLLVCSWLLEILPNPTAQQPHLRPATRHSVLGKSQSLEPNCEFECWLCCLSAVWPQASYSTSFCFYFLIHKMGMKIRPSPLGCYNNQMS